VLPSVPRRQSVAASPLGVRLFPSERRYKGLSILASVARAPGDGALTYDTPVYASRVSAPYY
jgi:hypothetical protein